MNQSRQSQISLSDTPYYHCTSQMDVSANIEDPTLD